MSGLLNTALGRYICTCPTSNPQCLATEVDEPNLNIKP